MLGLVLPRIWAWGANAASEASYAVLRVWYRLRVISFKIAGKFGWSYGVRNLRSVYDPKMDARRAIEGAVYRARSENKRVLIQWGGNWCPYCWKLRDLFEFDEPIRRLLADEYVMIMVDVESNQSLMEELEVEPNALPYLTFIGADGRKVWDQDMEALEEGKHHTPEKVLAMLEHWKTPKP